jgi:exodeoxyribonuclease VII large subunit
MPITYLTVAFREKDAVKALGARWDGEARKWYVPEGKDLSAFALWLPAGAQPAADLVVAGNAPAVVSAGSDLTASSTGVPLSRLLAGVAQAVSDAFAAGVWTTAEVLRVSGKGGHVFLELSERDSNGQVLAKANATIWARTAQAIIPAFEQATGAMLADGIKLMVRARPVFKPQFGFSLDIDAIDPAYTLGDLEARKRDIRERLKREQLFGRNKALPAPWDFTTFIVVSPHAAAGLGDFAKEADRLVQAGLCRIHYVHSRFQGEGAAGEIRQAMADALADLEPQGLPDAVVIIRGGGAVNDLAWLNDYDLARFICECPVPVLAGIGHERDDTLVDEVAHTRFDTPSKVIAGIEQHIVRRAREAQAGFDAVMALAMQATDRATTRTTQLQQSIRQNAMATIAQARATGAETVAAIRLGTTQRVHQAARDTAGYLADVRTGATQSLADARHRVPTAMHTVRTAAFAAVGNARVQLAASHPATLDRARVDLSRARTALDTSMQAVIERSRQAVRAADTGAEALVREIAGQGPEKTIGRGFAMVRTPDGKTLTTAQAAARATHIEVRFHDGAIGATVTGHRADGAQAPAPTPLQADDQDGTQELP